MTSGAARGRLSARPGPPPAEPLPAGLTVLEYEDGGEVLLYAPPGTGPDRPSPLVLLLHGAGGDARRGLRPLQDLADERGLVLVAPTSAGRTWDAIQGGYGPDVERLDLALEAAFERCTVDPARLAIGGFSDGASYALCLGLANGDLFSHVLAFAPGLVPGVRRVGAPRVYVAHGTDDGVLPIDRCSRRIVPLLRGMGVDVTYQEFDGPHTVPPEIARQAADWLLGPVSPA